MVGSRVVDSRVDYVLGLGRERLRAEIFKLDAIITNCEARIVNLNGVNSQLSEQIAIMNEHNSVRFDMLLSKQEQILDARLGLGVPSAPVQQQMKPIGRNRNWQADYEKKQRDEHWKKVIELQEKKDADAK